MRRFAVLALLLIIGIIFLGGCDDKKETENNINPYAIELGDENAGGYVVLQGLNCFPVGLYIHVDYDTIPFGSIISTDEPALLHLTPGPHHISVKTNGSIVAKDEDENPFAKVYLVWEKDIGAAEDYEPVVYLDCDSAMMDTVPWIDDNYEENDRMQAAYDLSADMDRALELIDGAGLQFDDDWYKITVDSSQLRVEISCDFNKIFGKIDMQLVDDSGNVLSTADPVDDGKFISFVLPSSGIYYIRIYGEDSGNEYDLIWKGLQPSE